MKTEKDLLDYLIGLAQIREMATKNVVPDYTDGSTRTKSVQSKIADPLGIVAFQNVKFGTYEVRYLATNPDSSSYTSSSQIVTVDADQSAPSVQLQVPGPTAAK